MPNPTPSRRFLRASHELHVPQPHRRRQGEFGTSAAPWPEVTTYLSHLFDRNAGICPPLPGSLAASCTSNEMKTITIHHATENLMRASSWIPTATRVLDTLFRPIAATGPEKIGTNLISSAAAATERKLARPAEPDRASEERLLCNFLNQLSAGKSEAAPRRSAAEALRSWPSAREVGFPVDVRGRRSERTFRR
ncbi:hypothetical protein GN956_G11600 [Arapaima gigas]